MCKKIFNTNLTISYILKQIIPFIDDKVFNDILCISHHNRLYNLAEIFQHSASVWLTPRGEEEGDKPLDEADKMLLQQAMLPLMMSQFMEPVMLLLHIVLQVMTHLLLLAIAFLESLEKTIPSMLKFLRLALHVMDKLMEVKTLSVKSFDTTNSKIKSSRFQKANLNHFKTCNLDLASDMATVELAHKPNVARILNESLSDYSCV